jgi:hypothetical protein
MIMGRRVAGRRVAVIAALAVVAVIAVVTARQVAVGAAEIAAADGAAAKSDWPEAIAHARAAAEALAPASPWPERGYRRLEAVGHDAETRGDDTTAMLAYGAMRTAALATRGPGSRSDAWRTTAEEGLARVAGARRDVDAPHVPAESMLEALRASEAPATWTLAALAVAVMAMVGGLAFVAWRGARARAAELVAAAGFVGYAVLLLLR